MTRLDELISHKERGLNTEERVLPHADGKAYEQSKKRIAEMKVDLKYWQDVRIKLSEI